MKTFGSKLVVGNKWIIQKMIPEGCRTPKWGVWRYGVHIGLEPTKRRAISVIEYWHETTR